MAKQNDKCKKLLANNEVCGKPPGYCIHNWTPTQFGELTKYV